MSEFPDWMEKDNGVFWNPSYKEAQQIHRRLEKKIIRILFTNGDTLMLRGREVAVFSTVLLVDGQCYTGVRRVMVGRI